MKTESFSTRRAARSAAYATMGLAREWRLVQDKNGWHAESCAVEESEHAHPTFEFFNEEDVRTAHLGRLYAAAVSFGATDVCLFSRDDLVAFVLKNLHDMKYPLDREDPEGDERARAARNRARRPDTVTAENPWSEPTPEEDMASKKGGTETTAKKAAKKTTKKTAVKAEKSETTETKATRTKPEKVERERRNGWVRPKPGSKTGRVWDIADEISKKKGDFATRAEVLEVAVNKEGAKLSMAATQYSRWRQFWGAPSERGKKKKAQDERAQATDAAQVSDDAAE